MRYLPVSLVVLAAAAAVHGQQVPLHLNLAPGQSWKYTSDQTTDSKNEISFNGQSQQINTVTKLHRSGVIKVLTAQNGIPGSIRVVFDKECSNVQEANGQQQTQPYPYAGATVTLTRGANGQVNDDFAGQADAETQADMHGLLDMDNVVMPAKAVAVGDEWPGDPAVVGRVLQLSGRDSGGMTLKLLSTKMVDNRSVAEVKISFAVMKNSPTINGKIISQGTVLVDLATGHTIKTDLHGTAELSGQQAGDNGQVYNIKGNGAVTIAGTAALDSAAAVAPMPVPAPAPGGGGANPLDANKLAPFVGAFSNEKLKVEFTRAGETLTGTIALNGKSYPATASLKDSSLAGTFTVDAQSYPFTATLAGDSSTLTLVSGSATYKLTKASRNPLDAEPANPLSPRSDAGHAGHGGAMLAMANTGAAYKAILPPKGSYDLASAAHGQAWAGFQGEKSATAALKNCVQQIVPLFGNSMKTANAAVDDKDREGFAPFTAAVNGQPVEGKMVCTPLTNGSFVSVFFARTDAGKDEWQALAASVPTVPQLHPIMLPGKNGTICVADGWRVTGGDESIGSVMLAGPNGELVSHSTFLNFQTPMHFKRMGIRPFPGANVSEFLAPSKAIPLLLEASNKNSNGSHRTIQHIEVKSIAASGTNDPDAVAEEIRGQILVTENGKDTLMDDITYAQSMHMPNADAWTLIMSGVSAPHDRFIHSQPTLIEIYNSYQLDDEALRENMQRAINHIVATAQEMHDQQERIFNTSQRVNADREAARHKSAIDTVEMLSGSRDVLDTQNGTMSSVDYYNVNGIVSTLNGSAGYGRFKQIPLSSQQ